MSAWASAYSHIGEQTDINVQNWVEDDDTEQYDALNEYERNAKSECTTMLLAALEKIVVKNPRLFGESFVEPEADQYYYTCDQRTQDARIRPSVEASTKIHSGEEKSQASGEQAKAYEI